jgi:hypothetical protein
MDTIRLRSAAVVIGVSGKQGGCSVRERRLIGSLKNLLYRGRFADQVSNAQTGANQSGCKKQLFVGRHG